MKETKVCISFVNKELKILSNVTDIFTGDKFIILTSKQGYKYVINIDQVACYSVDPWCESDDETDN